MPTFPLKVVLATLLTLPLSFCGGTDDHRYDGGPKPTPKHSLCTEPNADKCAFGDQCVTGNVSSLACGSIGNDCMNCAGGSACQDGACKPIPTGFEYNIVAAFGKINTTGWDPSWDGNFSEPDPFVVVRLKDGLRKSSTAPQDTYTPYWFNLLFSSLTKAQILAGFTVYLYDEDITYHDLISQWEVQPTDVQLESKSIALMDKNAEVVITFR